MSRAGKLALIIGSVVFALLVIAAVIWGFSSRGIGNYWGWMGPGMMGGYGGGWMMALVTVVFWGFIIWGVIALARGGHHRYSESSHGMESLLEILKRRYASGEINKDEYEQKKKDLLQ